MPTAAASQGNFAVASAKSSIIKGHFAFGSQPSRAQLVCSAHQRVYRDLGGQQRINDGTPLQTRRASDQHVIRHRNS